MWFLLQDTPHRLDLILDGIVYRYEKHFLISTFFFFCIELLSWKWRTRNCARTIYCCATVFSAASKVKNWKVN